MVRSEIFAAVTAVLLAGCVTTPTAPGSVDLAHLDSWDIVVAAQAPESDRYAAGELQQFLAEATGRKLPIVNDAEGTGEHIFVGRSAAMKASPAGFDVADLGPEDLRIVITADNVAIAGGQPRGTLYGVYTFLEDYLGVRFLSPDHTHVPRVPGRLPVGPIDRTYHPPLEYRFSTYQANDRLPQYGVRLRNNAMPSIPGKMGGRTKLEVINHSFGRQIPSRKYGPEHPEYFAEIGGKRLWDVKEGLGRGTQPCLTNPEVLRIVTASVLAELAAKPDKKAISVSQNDNKNYCRCPKCAAIDQREGTPMGSLLTFVNAVADAVAAKHPDVQVGTLAYWYSRKPPKTIKPHPNVIIQLANIECCLLHPIEDPNCPRNRSFRQDMDAWGELSDNIYIWTYNTNFRDYLAPCPNLQIIEPNIRYFVTHGAKGIYMQAAYNARNTEMCDLRNYVTSRLLWNPNDSGEALIDEFLELHYGKAAGPIRRFLDLSYDRSVASGAHPRCFDPAGRWGIDEKLGLAGIALFDEALRLAESDAVRARVEKASIAAYRAALEPIWRYRRPGPVSDEVAEKMRPLARRFFDLCQKHNVDMAAEGVYLRNVENAFRKHLGLKDGEDF